LDIAGIIDGLCPVRDIALATHGQVIKILIANRLTNPSAMVGVSSWAQAWAVPEVYGIAASALGDDRLARALDAVAEHVDEIIGSVGATAIDVTRLHWDMTSVSLNGAYDDADPNFPAPGWGHPKDRRTDLKQIQAGIAVSADGVVPVFHRAYRGGASEVGQIIDAMPEMQTMAGPRRFLMVDDSKLLSHANITALTTAGVGFLAPLATARSWPGGSPTSIPRPRRWWTMSPCATRANPPKRRPTPYAIARVRDQRRLVHRYRHRHGSARLASTTRPRR
jgi:hypothetical protein